MVLFRLTFLGLRGLSRYFFDLFLLDLGLGLLNCGWILSKCGFGDGFNAFEVKLICNLDGRWEPFHLLL